MSKYSLTNIVIFSASPGPGLQLTRNIPRGGLLKLYCYTLLDILGTGTSTLLMLLRGLRRTITGEHALHVHLQLTVAVTNV